MTINQLTNSMEPESFLSSSCYRCQSRRSLHAMEPTVITRPTTSRYPEPDQSNPRLSP